VKLDTWETRLVEGILRSAAATRRDRARAFQVTRDKADNRLQQTAEVSAVRLEARSLERAADALANGQPLEPT